MLLLISILENDVATLVVKCQSLKVSEQMCNCKVAPLVTKFAHGQGKSEMVSCIYGTFTNLDTQY